MDNFRETQDKEEKYNLPTGELITAISKKRFKGKGNLDNKVAMEQKKYTKRRAKNKAAKQSRKRNRK